MKYAVDPKYDKALDKASVVYTKSQLKRIVKRMRKARAAKKLDLAKYLESDLSEMQSLKSQARHDARLTHLAHMFLKGTPLEKVEDPNRVKTLFDFDDLSSRVDHFSAQSSREWMQGLMGWHASWYTTAHANVKARSCKQ